jgi:hypothetical protein
MNTPALVGNPGRRDRLYGIRTVDEDGGSSGDTMEGSPLPNRIGQCAHHRSASVDRERRLDGEMFTGPGGLRSVIERERVR